MYATVFTVVMVLQFTLLTVFTVLFLGCLGTFWDVLERHALDLN